jgi:cob(I)alamin adenosyltransferase
MKIYTKTGDKGETGIIGKRVSKSSSIIKLIGCFDELNAQLGIVGAISKTYDLETGSISTQNPSSLQSLISSLQNNIFILSSILAGAKNITLDFEQETLQLEKQIDEWTNNLPELQNFILPGGSLASAYLHLSRVICRKAERKLVKYIKKNKLENEHEELLKYINRLSDWLFTLSRVVNKEQGIEDVKWKEK